MAEEALGSLLKTMNQRLWVHLDCSAGDDGRNSDDGMRVLSLDQMAWHKELQKWVGC